MAAAVECEIVQTMAVVADPGRQLQSSERVQQRGVASGLQGQSARVFLRCQFHGASRKVRIERGLWIAVRRGSGWAEFLSERHLHRRPAVPEEPGGKFPESRWPCDSRRFLDSPSPAARNGRD